MPPAASARRRAPAVQTLGWNEGAQSDRACPNGVSQKLPRSEAWHREPLHFILPQGTKAPFVPTIVAPGRGSLHGENARQRMRGGSGQAVTENLRVSPGLASSLRGNL